ncbi:penicillin-binding protein activator [Lujinxingia vulgaris]|uniref:penicillin-binding protein activator n=1 Tax=Lujinxingia vulgaris TaxID=2600176 RepID=UPI001E468E03|nr:penicillin-binding protein activator [Lujinxingia vulgaris]
MISFAKWMRGALIWAALMVVAAGVAHAEPVGSNDPAQVVAVVPQSGELAGVGAQLVEVMVWAAEDAGAELVVIDSEADPGALATELERALRSPTVVGVVGPLRASPAGVVAALSARAQVPALLLSGVEGVEARSPWAFRARMSVGEQAAFAARWAFERWPQGRVGVMAPLSDYGDEAARAFVGAWNERGGRVAALARYRSGETQFTPVVETLLGQRMRLERGREVAGRRPDRWETLRAGQPRIEALDVLLLADFDDAVARQAPFITREDALQQTQLLGLAGWRGQRLEQAGQELAGAIFFDTFGGLEQGGAAEGFVLAFEARFERAPTTVEVEVFDLVVFLALRSRADANRALRSPEGFEGITGRWRFDSRGAPLREPLALRVTEDGRWVPLSNDAPRETP